MSDRASSAPADHDSDDQTVRLCFVCLGNICRSPTAEGIMTKLVADAGLSDRIEIDSAGTGAWHVGEEADERSRAEASRRGIALTSRARQFHPGDFYEFDLILALDHRNIADLHDAAPEAALRSKVHLLRSFDPGSIGEADGGPAATIADLSVPDPYYGGPNGFADVFDMVALACRGLLDHVKAEYGLGEPPAGAPSAGAPSS